MGGGQTSRGETFLDDHGNAPLVGLVDYWGEALVVRMILDHNGVGPGKGRPKPFRGVP